MIKDRIKILKALAASDFKSQFLALPPGPKREEFLFQEAIKRPLPKLIPIEVTDPTSGIKVKYDVMPDYLMIDGIRIPLSAPTAQRIANHFGMTLPTAKMSKQIWQAADTKVKPTPMSAGAFIGGKWLSGKEVVERKINTSDTSEAFNKKVDKEIADSSVGKPPTLVAGHMKDMTMPDTGNDQRTHAVGWYNPDGTPIQGGNGVTMHDLNHSEYATGTRLIGNKFTFTTKDGKTVGPLTLEQLLTDKTHPEYKEFAKTISNNPGAIKQYSTKPDPSKGKAPEVAQIAPLKESKDVTSKEFSPEKPANGKLQFLKRFETFLSDLMK